MYSGYSLFFFFSTTLGGLQDLRSQIRTGTQATTWEDFPVALVVKNSLANAGDIRDAVSIPDPGRSSGEGNGNPLQHSYLENPTDRGAWRATVHGVSKSWT